MKGGDVKKRSKKKKVLFSVEAPHAETVCLVGEFNHWDPAAHPMKNEGSGTWGKSLLLAEGSYEYKFVIDNQWVADPVNRQACVNCFGTRNSIVHVALQPRTGLSTRSARNGLGPAVQHNRS